MFFPLIAQNSNLFKVECFFRSLLKIQILAAVLLAIFGAIWAEGQIFDTIEKFQWFYENHHHWIEWLEATNGNDGFWVK